MRFFNFCLWIMILFKFIISETNFKPLQVLDCHGQVIKNTFEIFPQMGIMSKKYNEM